MDPTTITIISVIVANVTGCSIAVCAFAGVFYCIYSSKSKKNLVELTNTTPDGGETKLKFEYETEERSSKQGGTVKLGKASTIVANVLGKDANVQQYQATTSLESINANTQALMGCADAFSKAVESNNAVSTAAGRDKEESSASPSISAPKEVTHKKVIALSSNSQLREDVHNQAMQALAYWGADEQKTTQHSRALTGNSYEDDIV